METDIRILGVAGRGRGRGACLGLLLALLLLLDLPLLVEDLLGLAVADEQDNRGEDQDDRTPGAAVAKAKGESAGSSCFIITINFSNICI